MTNQEDYSAILNDFAFEEGFKQLAIWATHTPQPKPPMLIPGLPVINHQLMTEYRQRLLAWRVGKAEACLTSCV